MSIFSLQDARKDIFAMAQFARAHFHRDILYFLSRLTNIHIADDKLAQVVYLSRYPVINPDELDSAELARLQKINVKNIRALYVEEILSSLKNIIDYFLYLSDHDFRFIIPRKAERIFREYLNIAVKYHIEHASEAFESFSSAIKSPRLFEEYMFVTKSDMDTFLNRIYNFLDILTDKSKDPLANFFSFDDLKYQLCRRLMTVCRMSLPVRTDFEHYEEKDPILWKHVRAMNAPYFKIYNTADIVEKFTENHAFLMDNPIDIVNIGYTEDAALFIILRSYINKYIKEIKTGAEPNVDDAKVQPDTCGVK